MSTKVDNRKYRLAWEGSVPYGVGDVPQRFHTDWIASEDLCGLEMIRKSLNQEHAPLTTYWIEVEGLCQDRGVVFDFEAKQSMDAYEDNVIPIQALGA